MQQGNEKPTNFPERPAAPVPVHPQSSTPFRSPGTLTGSGAAAAPQTTMPFSASGPLAGPGSSGFRTPQPPSVRFNGPFSPPPSSYPTQSSSNHPQLQAPRFPPTSQQPISPLRGPPLGPPAVASPGSLHPQAKMPLVPAGLPPQTANGIPPRGNMPSPPSDSLFTASRPPPQTPLYGPSNAIPRANAFQPPADSHFSAPRPASQPPVQGFQTTSVPAVQPPFQPTVSHFSAPRPASQPPVQAFPTTSIPAVQPPFHAYQGGRMPPPPPTTGAPVGFSSREQMQYPNAGPPMGGTLQGLVEDFQSLSIGSVPGSLDAGIDPKSLPRPLDGDRDPTSILETYPWNCHPRFFRLTTNAIPSSQSLLSRWHLPLGAVVHPLAEAPDGVSKTCS